LDPSPLARLKISPAGSDARKFGAGDIESHRTFSNSTPIVHCRRVVGRLMTLAFGRQQRHAGKREGAELLADGKRVGISLSSQNGAWRNAFDQVKMFPQSTLLLG
jgi:hypothetical protein